MDDFHIWEEGGDPPPSGGFGTLRVGVLALQGAFSEHLAVLRALGVCTREVRLPADLEDLSGLIIPGGESTTMGLLAREYGLVEPLREFGRNRGIWGTCAGAILLSREGAGENQHGPKPLRLGLMDVEIRRNALGRQVDSFRENLRVPALDNLGEGETPFPAIFIRAPVISHVDRERVQVLACLPEGQIVAAGQGPHLATSFHPELTEDHRFHRHFLRLLRGGGVTSEGPNLEAAQRR